MTDSYNDCLRGLMDQRAFLRMLSVFGAGAYEADRFAALIIEVDALERVNALLRDESGDTLMRLVLGRVEPLLPAEALAARLKPGAIGLLVFDGASDEATDHLCAALHEAIRTPLTGGGAQIYLSASIGVAFTAPQCPPVAAMQHAERALERVKSNGGDATFVHRTHPFEVLNVEIAA